MESFFDDYRPLAEIDQFIGTLASTHRSLVTIKNVGESWQKRPLRVMEITAPAVIGGAAADKPVIFLEGGIHAREWIATAVVLHLAYNLVVRAAAEAGTGPVTSMLQDFKFVFLSPVNPDGYVYTWETDRFWRKTRSNREKCASAPDGVAGVDANRNWGYTRGMLTSGGEVTGDISDPCMDTYEGPSAFSEPETLAVATYLRSAQNASFARSSITGVGAHVAGSGYVAAFIDYHSYAMMLLPPWGYSAVWPSPPDAGYMHALCDSMAAAIKGASGRIFAVGPNLLPADPGTAPDWAYGELGVRATMTLELEGQENTGSFCLPKESIRPVGDEQFQSLLALVAHLRSRGSQPSSLFGLFAGMPPAPLPPARLWLKMKTDVAAWHDLLVPAICGLVFCVLLAFVVALGVIRRGKVPQSSSDSEDME